MTVTVIGNYPKVERVVSGFWSLDHALSNERTNEIGIPLTDYEVYGAKKTGKSTTVTSMAGIMGREKGWHVAYAPVESVDIGLIVGILEHEGFGGFVRFCDGDTQRSSKKEARYDELMLEELISSVDVPNATDAKRDPEQGKYNIAILDSIAHVSPQAEVDGDLQGTAMGRRAMLIARYFRRITRIQREKPIVTFSTNHLHPPIGNAFAHAYKTTGGETPAYIARVRMNLKKGDYDKLAKDFCGLPDGSYAIIGKIDDLSFGRSGRKFQVFNLAGYGLDVNMSAVLDCVCTGLAAVKAKKVYLGGEDMGKIVDLVELAKMTPISELINEQAEAFQPFKDALNGAGNVESLESEDEEGEE